MNSKSLSAMVFAAGLIASSGFADTPNVGTSTSSYEQPPPVSKKVERAMKIAESYIGVPYAWGGRDRESMDCQGIIITPYQRVFGFRFDATLVQDNKKFADSGHFGRSVPRLNGILKEDLNPALLRRGDVLYFLLKDFVNPNGDTPLLVHDGSEYRTWHTGLYAGGLENNVLHAHPRDGVRLQPLSEISFDALYVTRRKK